ncbi:acyl CoA:acetate/3-ketoacid CoA transferase [Raineyella sp. LH-20]|uniref:acyl CoA:acetate/3-ketoacid CoA transferase n=1 Tax=Raineyella sp. LH-20 TaxID=3081204 RepID=UPI002955860D|nr:malonate decarboxylase subunit alpha [Raineyella sp. LH-20]WOP19635.1 malonate decarboxylase subunit alpha [Raineyella sp. LH-20]
MKRDGLQISLDEAAALVGDGVTVVVGGSGSLLQVPESLLGALGDRFERTHAPRDLQVVHVMGLGDHQGRGTDHLARPGLVRRFIGSHFVLSPRQQALIADGQVEAFALPAGTITLLYREIAAGRPGLTTDIGIETHVDPRQHGGRISETTSGALSQVIELGGREWLHYPTFPIDVALIRASVADEDGNLTMTDEAAFSDNLAIAQAAHNSGGLVIAEVRRVVPRRTLPGATVQVPGVLVDHVVITEHPWQTPLTRLDRSRTGTVPPGTGRIAPIALDHRKVVARRAAMELHPGDLVNLGVGMANGISYVVHEEDRIDDVTFTVEQGIYGGVPGIGLDSGTAVDPAAIIDMSAQFDLYDGGALDFAGLAYAQIDRAGNVNVTRAGRTVIGPGGFIDIAQKAGTVVFCGTFTGGGLRTVVEDGALRIETEGRYGKFVDSVDAISFSARHALRTGQRVLYVTERAVFELRDEGLTLVELAPGVDLVDDLLALLPFTPAMPEPPRPMDARLFRPGPTGLVLPRRDTAMASPTHEREARA